MVHCNVYILKDVGLEFSNNIVFLSLKIIWKMDPSCQIKKNLCLG